MKDKAFWHKKWAENQIGFHLVEVNPQLKSYWSKLNPAEDDNVLVPLCGKSEDLVWLAEQHLSVQGVELSDIAVSAFFSERFYTPTVTQLDGHHQLYQFDELSIYVGDFFTAPLTSIDLVYDRAALVALPKDMRVEYVARLKTLLNPGGRMLLISLDYQQSEMAGPPFSVDEAEIRALFSPYRVTQLERIDADQSHRRIQQGLTRFAEVAWLIECLNE